MLARNMAVNKKARGLFKPSRRGARSIFCASETRSSTGKDSLTRKSMQKQITTDKEPATTKGAASDIWARPLPIAGPNIIPIPMEAPTIPILAPLFSGLLVSPITAIAVGTVAQDKAPPAIRATNRTHKELARAKI